MAYTFKGGIHPPEGKELAEHIGIRELSPPDVVAIPLSQHIGAPAKAVVKKGDTIKMGQIIGEAQGFVSCNIHSSVSGKVAAVEERLGILGNRVETVVIENDGKDTPDDTLKPNDAPLALSPDEIRKLAQAAGLSGMGGATFPTHIKLSSPKEKPIETVILNGAECEPFLTADHCLMLEFTDDIVQGALMVRRALGASRLIIAIEENKPDAIEAMRKAIPGDVEVAVLRTKYPQGAEKQLIAALTGKEVPSGGLPFDVGCYVQNVGTAKALYDAAKFGKPLYERVVTVTGPIVKTPANILARIGTPFSAMLDACEGTTDEIGKVLMGGPMMGLAQPNLDIPVTKGTSGILILPKSMAEPLPERACIGCAHCVDVCPMHLMPTDIASNIDLKRFDIADKLGALDCIECGSCSYICPANRKLLDRIRYGKREIMAARKRAQKK